jgi:glycine/betaine/sarcosine/D-proline reductase family selenoprotein B
VIVREIEKAGVPAVFITAMSMMGRQLGANRIVTGTKIPHPLGDPTFTGEADLVLRREIVKTALKAIQTKIDGPTIFVPNITVTSG